MDAAARRRAAARLTNEARGLFEQALALNDAAKQREVVRSGIARYERAAEAWRHVLAAGAADEDALYWLADAEFMIVCLKFSILDKPGVGEVERAQADSRAVVSFAGGPGRYRQASAYDLVKIADSALGAAPLLAPASEARRVTPEVAAAVSARDEYVAAHVRAPETGGVRQVGPAGDLDARYAYEAADLLLTHGDSQHALPRFRQVWEHECNRTDWGERARSKLLEARPSDETLRTPCALAGRE